MIWFESALTAWLVCFFIVIAYAIRSALADARRGRADGHVRPAFATHRSRTLRAVAGGPMDLR